jgi:hypothetical protein
VLTACREDDTRGSWWACGFSREGRLCVPINEENCAALISPRLRAFARAHSVTVTGDERRERRS